MPRYVILEHDWPTLHWDVFLESGEVLKAWKVHQPPAPGQQLAAELHLDHRLIYLDYEGPLSGGRGSVWRIDQGEYVPSNNGFSLRSTMQGWQVELVRAEAGWWLVIEAITNES